MFSGNQKISSRQLYRNYAAALISLGALLPPLVMNRESPGGVLLAILFLGLFLWGTASAPDPRRKAARWIYDVNYLVLGTMLARQTGLLVQNFLLTDTKLWVILLWFYLFCYYNLYKGLECRLRVSEILFPFFLFLLLLLVFLMHGEAKAGRLLELQFLFGRRQWALGYELFCWLGAAGSLWHLRGRTDQEGNFGKTVRDIWCTGALAAAGFAAFSYAIYGNAGHTGLVYPIASAMTLAHFPGNVIGRLDALFLFTWVIGLFLLCGSLFAPLAEGEAKVKKGALLAWMALSFGVACLPECMMWGQKVLYVVSTPLQLLLLLFLLLKKWFRGGNGSRAEEVHRPCSRTAHAPHQRHISSARACAKRKAAGCAALCVLLTGCGSQELERQSLVTAIGVDAGEGENCRLTFGFGTTGGKDENGEKGGEGEAPFSAECASIGEAAELYREYNRKNMDFNHLKNFYFAKETLGSERLRTLLQEIQINGAYSRGTLVHVTEGPAGEEAARASAQEGQSEEGIPVHRLLNAWYNGESCRISVITEDGRYKGYVSWP